MNLKNSENIAVLGIFLGLTGLISALILAVVSQLAAEPIRAAESRAANAAIKELLPPFDNRPGENQLVIKNRDGREYCFKGALKQGKLVGIAAEGFTKAGYGGKISAAVGLNPDGSVRSVLITGQNETPGLGTRVCERKRQKTIFNFWEKAPAGLAPNPVLDQFSGKSVPAGGWKLKRDGGSCDCVTGATVTSRAVVALVSDLCSTYLAHRAEIVKQLSGGMK